METLDENLNKLLFDWKLSKYGQILFAQGYRILDDWQNLSTVELTTQLKFLPGEAKRFVRKVKQVNLDKFDVNEKVGGDGEADNGAKEFELAMEQCVEQQKRLKNLTKDLISKFDDLNAERTKVGKEMEEFFNKTDNIFDEISQMLEKTKQTIKKNIKVNCEYRLSKFKITDEQFDSILTNIDFVMGVNVNKLSSKEELNKQAHRCSTIVQNGQVLLDKCSDVLNLEAKLREPLQHLDAKSSHFMQDVQDGIKLLRVKSMVQCERMIKQSDVCEKTKKILQTKPKESEYDRAKDSMQIKWVSKSSKSDSNSTKKDHSNKNNSNSNKSHDNSNNESLNKKRNLEESSVNDDDTPPHKRQRQNCAKKS